MSFKQKIKPFIPKKILEIYRKIRIFLFPRLVYRVDSYSQNGEDRILARIYERQRYGFYVDIGAHHPFRFSNTYLLYKRGWNGINIDAMPKSMELFNKYRNRDINIECGVGLCIGGGDGRVFCI